MSSPQLRRRARPAAAASPAEPPPSGETKPAAPAPEPAAAVADGPKCPLGFSGPLPSWHAPVPASSSGSRCPFGFGGGGAAAAAAAAAGGSGGATSGGGDGAAAATAGEPPLPWRLLSAAELPAWMRDNDYIRAHYRPQMNSVLSCLRSGFLYMTNETMNVWTHFVGFLLFMYLAVRLCARTGVWTAGGLHLPAHLPQHLLQHLRHLPDLPHAAAAAAAARVDAAKVSVDAAKLSALSTLLRARGFAALRRAEAKAALGALGASAADVVRAAGPLLAEHRWGMMPLLATASFCTAASTAYHVFWVYSPRALHVFGKFDFVGIALLCGGHAVSGTFYMFFCKPEIATRYYVGVAVFVIFALCAIFTPRFQAPAYRVYRTIVFVALGGSSIIPLAHAGYLHSWHQDRFGQSLSWMSASAVAYLLGAAIYASRYPECCRPGKHDRFWASHQLMHLAVIAGGSFHAYGCHSLMRYRLDQGCAASPFL